MPFTKELLELQELQAFKAKADEIFDALNEQIRDLNTELKKNEHYTKRWLRDRDLVIAKLKKDSGVFNVDDEDWLFMKEAEVSFRRTRLGRQIKIRSGGRTLVRHSLRTAGSLIRKALWIARNPDEYRAQNRAKRLAAEEKARVPASAPAGE